jgi:hypothetical protein
MKQRDLRAVRERNRRKAQQTRELTELVLAGFLNLGFFGRLGWLLFGANALRRGQ